MLIPPVLLKTLPHIPKNSRLWIAYSGGCDSHLLLYLLHQLRSELGVQLHAIHVNHGLSPYADQWTEHCHRVCAELGLPLVALKVNAKPQPGQSPEEAARNARYQAIRSQLAAGDYLCTAHHQDDQAETLLLQLLRGAGPKGLAAMGAQSVLGHATQLRPLLHLSREEIQRCAEANGLVWIDDQSNSDTRYDRNYLRHEVMPLLKQRWPAAARTISRSADHCADAAELLETLAEQDWRLCSVGNEPEPENISAVSLEPVEGAVHSASALCATDMVTIVALQALPLARQKNLLRYWVALNGLPLPSEAKLHQILNEVMGAGGDRAPCVTWPGAEVRRYQGRLYIMPPLPPFDSGVTLPWRDTSEPLLLPDGRTLVALPAGQCPGLSASCLQQGGITVRYRQGGEVLVPANSSHHKTLKQLFQERRTPPWLRDRIPLLYVGSELLAVVGLCLAQQPARQGEGLFKVVLK